MAAGDVKFAPKGYNDLWAAVLFLVQGAIVLGWIAYASGTGKYVVVQEAAASEKVAALLQGKVVAATSPQEMVYFTITLAFIGLIFAVLWGALWLFLLQTYPSQTVWISLWAYVALLGALGVLFLVLGSIFGGIIMFLLAALCALLIWCCREQIKFTAKCLQAVTIIYKKQPSIFMVALAVIAMQIAWVILMIFAIIPIIINGGGAAIFLVLFAFFWGTQVIANILHVTCAGVLARWYFNQGIDKAVSTSFGQACTNYFGTICYGSLLIAIIQTMRVMCEMLKEQGESNGNIAIVILAYVAICCLDCLESIIRLFNTFAFIVTAIYSLPFCEAGKRGIDILTRGHCDVLTKSNFAGIVCFMGNLLGATVVCITCCLIAWALGLTSDYILAVGIISFLGAFCILMVVSRLVESGCDTLFLCFGDEKKPMRETAPEIADIFGEFESLQGSRGTSYT